MTQTQIEKIIGSSSMNRWINLSDEFNIITFISEKKLFLMQDGSSKQLYFDPTADVLYVRFTDGSTKIPATEPKPGNRWVTDFINGTEYWVKLVDGGITKKNNANVGIYHEVWALSHLLGFFAPMV